MPDDTKLAERIDAALQRECAASLVPYGQEPPREKRIAVIEEVLAKGSAELMNDSNRLVAHEALRIDHARACAELERLRAAIAHAKERIVDKYPPIDSHPPGCPCWPCQLWLTLQGALEGGDGK